MESAKWQVKLTRTFVSEIKSKKMAVFVYWQKQRVCNRVMELLRVPPFYRYIQLLFVHYCPVYNISIMCSQIIITPSYLGTFC